MPSILTRIYSHIPMKCFLSDFREGLRREEGALADMNALRPVMKERTYFDMSASQGTEALSRG